MNRFLLFLLMACALLPGMRAQNNPEALKKGIAPFKIQLVNGKYATSSNLKKGMPVMIVYFDPDCDHCRLFISDLLTEANLFKQVQLVMVTYVPLKQVKTYVKSAGIDKYPQILVGTEGMDFIVRYHYNVVQFPYLALHDKAGKLINTFESEVPSPAELAKMF